MSIQRLAILLGCLSLPAAYAQLRVRPRFPIGTAEVAKTVAATFSDRGIAISLDQLSLPVAVLSSEEAPALEVTAIQPLGNLERSRPSQTSAGVRLRCRKAGACLPFYAVVTWQQADAPLRRSEVALVSPAGRPAAPSLRIIAPGARVTLLMEADHASIRMDAISLGSATAGQPVRVSSSDRKHIYQAVAVNAGLVKGSF